MKKLFLSADSTSQCKNNNTKNTHSVTGLVTQDGAVACKTMRGGARGGLLHEELMVWINTL